MSKNRSAAVITNIIRQDSSGNIVFTSGSTTLATISTAGQLSGSTAVKSATTASYADNFTVAGTLTAQTLVVQTITSSVSYITGSTKFGSISGNTHQFTGSVLVTGSIGLGSTSIKNTASGRTVLDINGSTTSWINLDANDTSIAYIGANSTNGFINTDGAAYYLTLGTNGSEVMRVTGSRVGIGTTSPSSVLDIKGTGTYDFISISNNSTSGGGGVLTKQNGTASSWFGNSGGWEGGTSNDTGIGSYAGGIRFYTAGGTEKMRITSAGNVGIGTTNPSYLLDVNGYGRFKINALSAFGLDVLNNAGTRGAGFYNTGGNNVQLYFYNSSSTETIVLDSTSGNLELKGYMKGGAVYATSGYVNETQTISTAATVYSLNKDQGASGGSSATTFNITGIPNTDGAFAFIYARSSNTAAGINVGITIQIHGNTVFSTSTQNVTKTASFFVFKQNGSWVTSAAGTGGTLGYP